MAGLEMVDVLLSTRRRALLGYAYLLCGDTHEAEDLLQDALVKSFARRRPGLGIDSAEAYVRRTMLTLFVDGWRRRGRWALRMPLLADATTAASHEHGVGQRIDVVNALRALPRQQRACVVLRFYADLSVAEIAADLSVSQGAVKRYLSMGVRQLETLLGPIHTTDSSTELVQEAKR